MAHQIMSSSDAALESSFEVDKANNSEAIAHATATIEAANAAAKDANATVDAARVASRDFMSAAKHAVKLSKVAANAANAAANALNLAIVVHRFDKKKASALCLAVIVSDEAARIAAATAFDKAKEAAQKA